MIKDSSGKRQSINDVRQKGYRVFFRVSIQDKDHDLIDTTLGIIRESEVPVVILTDDPSLGILETQNEYIGGKNIYLLERPFNLSIEKAKIPYFFLLTTDNKVTDIFVPRKEIPEVTAKYLTKMKAISNE